MNSSTLISMFPHNTELKSYIDDLLLNGNMDIDDTFLGFLEDYKAYADIIIPRILDGYPPFLQKRNFTIIDVGCAVGIQHVFFEKCERYIGIDTYISPFVKGTTDNATFIKGKFSSLVSSGQLVIPDNAIGIANMSLLYSNNKDGDIELFKNSFKRMFIF